MELLDVVLRIALDILGESVIEQLLEVVIGIAARVADADACLLALGLDLLGQLLTALTGERWDGDADVLAIVARRDA